MRLSLLVGLLVATVAALGFATWWMQADEAPVTSSLSLSEAMGGDTTGYARAMVVRDFVFPEDHGPHPGFKVEWWYYTGNLTAADGRRFGYQFTLFRVGNRPLKDTPDRSSDWATPQLYMGHIGITDIDGEQFYSFERFSRAAAGLAGAQATPFRVWLETWETRQATEDEVFPMRLTAGQEGVAFDLTLAPAKPHVLQGDRGLDPKGPEPGNASYYYSFTRLATEGTLTIDGETIPVTGLSWMDREWSTSALGGDQVGWDWFALQLSSGDDLMYYQLRNSDGSADATSSGILVDPDGQKVSFDREAVQLEVTETWTSPVTDATYPAGWRLVIPGEAVDLQIRPMMNAQEMDVSVRYWEGAVAIEGTLRGQPVDGRGYVEMTGYGPGEGLESL